MGARGMPRRYYTYPDEFTIWHQLSTIGSYIMALGFLLMAYYLLQSLVSGKKAHYNPWGGNSLEWHCQSPPIHENFKTTPMVRDCYDYTTLQWDEAGGGYVPRVTPPPPQETPTRHGSER